MSYIYLALTFVFCIGFMAFCLLLAFYITMEGLLSIGSMHHFVNTWNMYLLFCSHLTGLLCFFYVIYRLCIFMYKQIKNFFHETETEESCISPQRWAFLPNLLFFAACLISVFGFLSEYYLSLYNGRNCSIQEELFHFITILFCLYVGYKKWLWLFDYLNS